MRFEWPVLRRCCFCFPLRQGVLILGYINILLSVFMAIVNLYEGLSPYAKVYMGRLIHFEIPVALLTIMHALEFTFNIVLVCGIHTKKEVLLKIYYYFMISTLILCLIIEIIDLAIVPYKWEGSLLLFLATTFVNMYLLCLVRSLFTKMEISECNEYGNQLQQIVNGETNVKPVDPYSNTVLPENEIV